MRVLLFKSNGILVVVFYASSAVPALLEPPKDSIRGSKGLSRLKAGVEENEANSERRLDGRVVFSRRSTSTPFATCEASRSRAEDTPDALAFTLESFRLRNEERDAAAAATTAKPSSHNEFQLRSRRCRAQSLPPITDVCLAERLCQRLHARRAEMIACDAQLVLLELPHEASQSSHSTQ